MNIIERKWEDLAFDCLVHIFCYLSPEDLIVVVPFVCKSWYEASSDHRCWKNLYFRELCFCSGRNLKQRFKYEYGIVGKNFSFSSFMKICVRRRHGSSVELTIPSFEGALTQKDLIYASIECPRLKLLSLRGVPYKVVKQLPDLISKWKELEIQNTAINPFSISEILEHISISSPNFVGLHIHGLSDTEETRAIVRWMPRLKILVIRDSILCKQSLMEILEGCRDLDVLDVSNCAGFDSDDDEILMKASKIGIFDCECITKSTLMDHLLLDRATASWMFFYQLRRLNIA